MLAWLVWIAFLYGLHDLHDSFIMKLHILAFYYYIFVYFIYYFVYFLLYFIFLLFCHIFVILVLDNLIILFKCFIYLRIYLFIIIISIVTFTDFFYHRLVKWRTWSTFLERSWVHILEDSEHVSMKFCRLIFDRTHG